jgi:enoyl-CoA hydratase/carnithine racemase
MMPFAPSLFVERGRHLLPVPISSNFGAFLVRMALLMNTSVCDLRYATPASRFGVPVARTLGNCITLKNYRHLVDAFGAMKTKEMLFTAHLLTATDALQCGFLTAIVDEKQLIAHVTGVAQQISSLAPLTIWATKEAQRRLNAAEETIDFDDVIARVYTSSDFAEGVQAYLEKRKANWRGQ